MILKIGEPAPSFELPDQNGQVRRLKDYRGSWVLLYFYPKDDTPGCTKEACAIRDNFPDFQELELKVLGVSIDSVESHEKFAEKYDLPFTLLSDEKKEVVGKYGVWGKKMFLGREFEGTLRTSFLIDPEGKIAKIYEDVKPEIHAKEVLNFFQQGQAER
ncbi:MAG: thioredoxin-dependent thiol peroxidase [Minisyncoccia bacterium]|jgi:peroxiredoxin Q/BCP